MCGIVGIVSAHGKDMAPALQAIHHRGPDGRGAITIDAEKTQIYLGHTRLAILDLSEAGHQPMWSHDRRWCLTFNGEIYNHLELRKNLNILFRGHSDTETLVEHISHFGIEKTLQQLNGMFAFAALDTQEWKLYIARDSFGIKNTYYTEMDDGFAFASEVRALRALGAVNPSVDPIAASQLLTLRYTTSPTTIWQNIQRLGPGELLILDIRTGQKIKERFSKPNTGSFKGSLQEAVSNYREILTSAINRQLLSDVPVGMLLSGGIDSALIAAMAKSNGYNLSTYTVGFGVGSQECEIAEAEHTASVLGLKNTVTTVSSEDLRNIFIKCVRQIEEPLGTVSVLPMWYLCELARKDVKVVLSGQGSDEPWGGYRRHQLEILRSKLPSPTLWLLLGRLLNNEKIKRRMPEFLRRAVHAVPIENRAQRFAASYELFSANERAALLGFDSDGGAREQVEHWLEWLDKIETHPSERMLRIDTRMNLSDDLLLYTDKISMAHALEVRVPMLDNTVIEFIESLPIEYRVKIGKTKIVHRALSETYLPKEIVYRPKKGFQVPLSHWLRTQWREWAESILFAPNSKFSSLIDIQALRPMWNDHLTMRRDLSTQLFTLLNLAILMEAEMT